MRYLLVREIVLFFLSKILSATVGKNYLDLENIQEI